MREIGDTADYRRQDAWLAKWPDREVITAHTLWLMLAATTIAIEDYRAALTQIRDLQPIEPDWREYQAWQGARWQLARAKGRWQAAQIADAALRGEE